MTITTPAERARIRGRLAALQTIANRAGYAVEYRPTVRVRGWPAPSSKPFALYTRDGAHLASFATLAALQHGLATRANV